MAVEVHQYNPSSSDLHFELELKGTRKLTEVVRQYYYAGGQRVALREGTTLYYFLSDHLGSTSITTDSTGNQLAELRYTPWGEDRASGYAEGDTPTDYRFTGQREEAEVGLYFYQARWYDAQLGRFLQADPIIPIVNNPLAYDRYQYVYSNPFRYTDPTGHRVCDSEKPGGECWNIPHTLTAMKRQLYARYGVTLTNGSATWTYSAAEAVYIAVRQTDQVMGKGLCDPESSICNRPPSGSTFNAVFGSQDIILNLGETNRWGGLWSQGNIKLYGQFPIELVLHELGHAFDTAAGNNPGITLAYSGIYTANGAFVSGGMNGSYDRQNNGFITTLKQEKSTSSGYFFTQLHPRSWEPDGNTGAEEFADMFMNYTLGNAFAPDRFGEARLLWMTTNLSQFIHLSFR